MQDFIKMARASESDAMLTKIKQPDENMGYSFETTYTEDTTRVQSGVLNNKPMFTVEAFTYHATNVSVAEMRQILQYVVKGYNFKLHYFSPYYGDWKTDLFYVGKGDLAIGRLNESNEYYEELSIQFTGVNPL